MKLNFTIPKFIRFGLVGVVNTVIDLGILNMLVFVFGVAQPFLFSLYKGFSFVCALLNSYFMNKNFTFEVKENNKKKTFYLFVFYSLIGFMVNVTSASLFYYLLSFAQMELSVHTIATMSGLVGTFLGLAVNYISYNFLVFK